MTLRGPGEVFTLFGLQPPHVLAHKSLDAGYRYQDLMSSAKQKTKDAKENIPNEQKQRHEKNSSVVVRKLLRHHETAQSGDI